MAFIELSFTPRRIGGLVRFAPVFLLFFVAATSGPGGSAAFAAQESAKVFSQSAKAYSTRRAAFLPWGKEEKGAGLISGPEWETGALLSWALDNGTTGASVLLLDSAQHVVKRVDLQSGKIAVVARGMAPSAICGDGAGGFVAREGNRMITCAADGQIQAEGELNSRLAAVEGYGMDLFADSESGIWLAGADQRVHCVAAVAAASAPVKGPKTAGADVSASAAHEPHLLAAAEQARKVALGRPARITFSEPRSRSSLSASQSSGATSQTLHFSIPRMEREEIRLLGFDEDGKARVSIPVKLDRGRAGAALFRGADAAGRLYVEIERVEEDGRVGLEVRRYSPSGALLAVFDLPNNYHTTIYKRTEICPDGQVLQVLTTRRGVDILLHAM